MNLKLENKVALVTGSTAGIGFAIAKALAAEGARVIVNGRTEARVAEAIASLRAGIPSAKLEALALDLSKAGDATETTTRYPDLDVLVNNLGAYQPKPFEQITDADWSAIIETNFLRFATTDEVAAMVAFVASPLSSATNGAALRVEGGVLRSLP